MRKLLSTLLLLALMSSVQAQEQCRDCPNAVEMLRVIFCLPHARWQEHLERHRWILDDKFFQNVELRIRWGLENGHLGDVQRFQQVAELARMVRFGEASLLYLNPLNMEVLTQSLVLRDTPTELQDWPRVLEQIPSSALREILELCEERVSAGLASGNPESVQSPALLGDLAAAFLGEETNLRLSVAAQLREGQKLRIPMDPDPRVMVKGVTIYGRGGPDRLDLIKALYRTEFPPSYRSNCLTVLQYRKRLRRPPDQPSDRPTSGRRYR